MDLMKVYPMVCSIYLIKSNLLNVSGIELTAYTKYIREEYMDTLRSRLTEDEMKDPAARREAMKVEVACYQEHLDNYVQAAKDSGKLKPMVNRMVKPVLSVVRFITTFYLTASDVFIRVKRFSTPLVTTCWAGSFQPSVT